MPQDAFLTAAVSVLVLTLTQSNSTTPTHTESPGAVTEPQTQPSPAPRQAQPINTSPAKPTKVVHVVPHRHVAIRTVVFHFVDPSPTITVAGQRVQRSFETIVRYPVGLSGPFPLVVFGHGFAVTPDPYSLLLDSWARAGYVVAAPIFPLENANAPGGPNENDLPDQPGDMSLVINNILSPDNAQLAKVADLVDVRHIAVAGQSDGGDTALAAAYDPQDPDPHITAAIILSGAEDPFAHQFAMPPDGPPLLAIQGTADTINPPDQTYAFFQSAARPKLLLKLLGAGHQPPYTQPGPELTEVEHMTLAFLNHYFKRRSPAFPRYLAARSAGTGSILIAEP